MPKPRLLEEEEREEKGRAKKGRLEYIQTPSLERV
jgi:hypothetical protein